MQSVTQRYSLLLMAALAGQAATPGLATPAHHPFHRSKAARRPLVPLSLSPMDPKVLQPVAAKSLTDGHSALLALAAKTTATLHRPARAAPNQPVLVADRGGLMMAPLKVEEIDTPAIVDLQMVPGAKQAPSKAGPAKTAAPPTPPMGTDPSGADAPAQVAPPYTGPKMPPLRAEDLQVPPPVTLPAGVGDAKNLPEPPLSLAEAIRIGLRGQPQLGIARGAIEQAQGRTVTARAALQPQIVAGAGFDQLGTFLNSSVVPVQAPTGSALTGVSSIDRITAQVALRKLVYDFKQTRNLVNQSRQLEQVAQSGLTVSQLSLILAIKAAFYNLKYAQQVVAVNERNVANRQRQLDLALARLNSGLGLPADAVSAETTKSQAILTLNTARNSAELARIALLQQMGVNPLTPMTIADEDEPATGELDVTALTERALRQRPEVLSAQAGIRAAAYGLDAARKLNSPSVFAGVAAGVRGVQSSFNDNTLSLQLGVQFPLLDGGQRRGAVQTSNGSLTIAQAQLDTATLGVRSDVTNAYLALLSAQQGVSIADNEVVNAQESVRIAEGRYRSGLGQFVDITVAQGLLLTAQTDQTQARNTLNQALSRLAFATGDDTKAIR